MSSLREIRSRLGLSQAEMASLLDLAPRTYQNAEKEPTPRLAYVLAAEQVALQRAVETGDMAKASPQTRRLALELARLVTG